MINLWNASRVLICGSRDYTNRVQISVIVSCLPPGTTIIEGGARGADALAKQVAGFQGLPLEEYPANWEKFGVAAGPIRNK